MLIRPMTREDLPEVFIITSETFRNDEMYVWLHPHQDKYPEDLRRSQHILLKKRLVSPDQHGFVAVTEESDPDWSGTSEVTGFAFFVRSGNDKAGKKWRTDILFNKLERYLLSWELSYEHLFLNRVSDQTRMKQLQSTTLLDFYEIFGPRWHLGILGISPNHQRKGIGGRLVRYGQDLATKENLLMTLEASVIGRLLYAKEGFKVVEEGEIAGGFEVVSMVWEPEGSRGKWLTDRGEGRADVKGRK